MSLITIAEAAKIIGVSKRTLMRWDKNGKFPPKIREDLSRSRGYDKDDVENLKTLLDHEGRYLKIIRDLKQVVEKLNSYENVFLLTEKEGNLLDREDKFRQSRRKLMDEFNQFSSEIKHLYKQFFIGRKL